MKIHPNVAEAVVGSLLEIFKGGKHADKIVEKTLKGHTKWGSRDRRFVAETVYDLVRWWRSYWSMAGLPDDECGVPGMGQLAARVADLRACITGGRRADSPACASARTFTPAN